MLKKTLGKMEPVVLRNIVSRTLLSFKFKKSLLQGFSKCKARCLSTSAQPQPEKINNVCRTHENDTRNHTLDHVGLYYTIPVEEINGVLKNCVHPWHLRLMNTFNEYGMMVRKPAIELNGYIQNVNLNHPIPRFVLYGRTGAGKASILLHTMQRFHRDGWLILSVPWAGRWVRGWYKEVSESTYKAGRYDLPTDGAEWLAHFKHQNEGKLANLKTTSEYIWTKRENAAVGTPIEEIINFGQTRIKFSSDCVGVILKEIRNQAQTLGLKVLVVVNAVNAFYTQWNQLNALKNSGKKKLHPSEISLIHNFKKMLTPTWTNGVAVCTVQEACNNLNERENYTPLYLLKQEGFEALDPFVPILVPEYTEKEALSTINYYIEHNWIQNAHGRTEEGKKEIIFVSNNNPFKLYEVCTSL